MASHHIRSGQALLAAEQAGSGTPMVFLHAGVADRRMWRAQLDAFRSEHHVIAYDRRGFGETVAADETFSHIADCLAVLDQVASHRPAILVGCSQGGRISIDVALRNPERVQALILIASAVSGWITGPLDPELQAIADDIERAESDGDLARVNALEARLWLDGPLAPAGRVSGHVRDLFLDMNGIALSTLKLGQEIEPPSAVSRLGQISVPTLIVCGTLDLEPVQERCRALQAAIPRSRLHILPGAAHLPSLEQPDAVSGLIRDFMKV